jgi:hypothetical protein
MKNILIQQGDETKMRNINILYYAKVKQADIYESMFEYVKNYGVSVCEKDYIENQPEYFVEEWQVALDSVMYVVYDVMKDAGEIEIDGTSYTRISRGENDLSYVPTENLSDSLYIIYHCDHNIRKCNCTNEIFQTKEEAEKRVNELRGKSDIS